MKKVFVLLALMLVLLGGYFIYQEKIAREVAIIKERQIEQERIRQSKLAAEKQAFERRLKTKAAEALKYAKANGYDLQHVMLIDFSVHSGKKRFFVWNQQTGKVDISSLVAHGYGNEDYRSTATKIIFSNVEGSYASSLGKYRIGIRSYSKWGINVHYKLHGLEKSNDNAYKRFIVLHSYQYLPENETYPFHLPLGYSQGCPVIDDQSMRQVDALMKTKTKPVLLWMYYD
jgi:hypothetical protein